MRIAWQARIRTFPLDDPDAAMYAPDVVSFAQRKGLYPQVGSARLPFATCNGSTRCLCEEHACDALRTCLAVTQHTVN